MTSIAIVMMAIENVSLPINSMVIFHVYVNVYQGDRGMWNIVEYEL